MCSFATLFELYRACESVRMYYISLHIDKEREIERTNEKKNLDFFILFFINEGNGISTIRFSIQPSGKKQNKTKTTKNRKQNHYKLKKSYQLLREREGGRQREGRRDGERGRGGGGDGGREGVQRQTETGTERQTDRQTDRQADRVRQTDSHIDR